MVDEQVRAYRAMTLGHPHQISQGRLIFFRESIPGSLDTVIEVHYSEAVLALWGLGPSLRQLFGASTWAYSNPQEPDGCRFDERSLALESVDDPWMLQSRVAHNHEALDSFSRHRREREADVRTEVGHECAGFLREWYYARMEEQDL